MNPAKIIIIQTFFDLLEQKKFSKITTEDILTCSNTSRSTFYRYFQSKYDLRNQCYRYYVDPILKTTPALGLWEVCRRIYVFSQSHISFFTNILANDDTLGADSFMTFFKDYSYRYYEDLYCRHFNTELIPSEISLTLLYLANAQVETMTHWILSQCRESPEQLADIMISQIPSHSREWFAL